MVPLGVLLPEVSGQEILCGPSERWGAGRLFVAFGYRRPNVHDGTSRVLEVSRFNGEGNRAIDGARRRRTRDSNKILLRM